jgi:hypothetical protein
MKIETESYLSIKDEYRSALSWMQSLGVNFTSGRTKNYERAIECWIANNQTASAQLVENEFPDFVSSIFEIKHFIDIYRALRAIQISELTSIAEKLQKGVNGPINSADETSRSTTARNFIFEAIVAARFHRPINGISTIFNSASDTAINIDGSRVYIECKRITSLEKLESNVKKACDQLKLSIASDISSKARGIVALDFTKIINAGDKLLVKNNDEELASEIDLIADEIIIQFSGGWQKIYKSKGKKIIGTLVFFNTMAVSEERKLLVKAGQWVVNPQFNIGKLDDLLLQKMRSAVK